MSTCTLGQSVAPARRGAFARGAAPVVAAAPVRARCSARRQALVCEAAGKNILMVGGTRFIGVYLARELIRRGHSVTLFTRGKAPIAFQIPDDTPESFEKFKSQIKHIKGDRKDAEGIKAALGGKGFEVVFDLNGREAVDTKLILDAIPNPEQYIYCSSAGVYLKTDTPPHVETDAVDFKSRHKGKLETEQLLKESGVNWTSVRPVYIYGPLNYNPVEEWFFHRIHAGRPVPVPGSGMQITQMGHVADLAVAFANIVGNPKTKHQIYNVADSRYVTFDGMAKLAAKAMGKPEPEIVHYKAKDFKEAFGDKKAFPFREQHFFADCAKARDHLNWEPKYDLLAGLRDSYEKDFARGNYREAADFFCDDLILAKAGKATPVKELAGAK